MDTRLTPFLLPLLFLVACRAPTRLPGALAEASGLAVTDASFVWHNDSGDGPYLYRTDAGGELLGVDTLAAGAVDYEDLTQDPAGRLYVGDFGNNRGTRRRLAVYRYDPRTGRTDTIAFTYPGQDGRGRGYPGNHDCEALVWYRDSLHLFTKDQVFGRGRFITYHYRLPARPGVYVAELIDSLRIPRRVITGAALTEGGSRLVLTAYNFRFWGGFWPSSAASLLTLGEAPAGRWLRGRLRRRNLSWGWPTQFEAVAPDPHDHRYVYVASEATRVRPRAVVRRRKIR